MKKEIVFNIGDLLLYDEIDLYYCTQIKYLTYVFIMLNPKKPHTLRKRLIYKEEIEKIISNPLWKHYPVQQ